MASTGKKGKKAKGKTVSLTDFLSSGASNDDGTKVIVAAPSSGSWADEMDEYDEGVRVTERIVLPTAPKAALGPAISEDQIPREPPFTARISNIQFEVTEQDIIKFFGKIQIKSVRLLGDESGRPRGYGYADFENREGLVEALSMHDSMLRNRRIRVELASSQGGGRDHAGGDRRGGGRHGDDGDDRTAGDWRSGPAPPARTEERRPYERDERRENNRGYGFDRRGEDRGFDRGGERGGDRYERREGGDRFERREGGDRYERRDERGGERFERREGGGDRYGSRDEGGDRYGRGGRHGYDRRSPEREAARERPKLVLKKRTVEAGEENPEPVKSSIFGGAKPVDTTKREKEIEEKLHSKPLAHHETSRPSGSEHSDHDTENHDAHHKHDDDDRHKHDADDHHRHADDHRRHGDDHHRHADDRHKHEDDHHKHEDDHHKHAESVPEKPKSSASIFGQAKPVDTSAREKRSKNVYTENQQKSVNLSQRMASGNDSQDSHGHDSKRGGGSRGDDRHEHGGRGGGHRDGGNRRFGDRDGGRGGGPRREDRPPHHQNDRKQDQRSNTPPLKKYEEAPPPQENRAQFDASAPE